MQAAALPVLACLLLCGCGYVGPVVPPSPELPTAVTDLSVIERGDQIQITFSTPARTTDNLPIKRFSDIDLRMGPAPTPFDFDRWSATAKPMPVPPPEPSDPDDPRPQPMERQILASQWVGQRIAVAVRTSVKSRGHFSPWSNVVRLEVVTPLSAPIVSTKFTAQGVDLKWQPSGEGAHYEIFRQGPADKQPVHIGTAEHAEYLDTTAQYDTPYKYSAIAARGAAESLPSKTVEITSRDIFPPAVPTGVTALATPDSIEISWQRSPEADLKGYYVYRSVNGGPFTRRGDLINLPTYADHNVEHGNSYRYEISAIDQKNNESDRSSTVEVIF